MHDISKGRIRPMTDLKQLRALCDAATEIDPQTVRALIDEVERYKKALRSIELSVDAVKGGGSPENALKQIKGKARQALKGTGDE